MRPILASTLSRALGEAHFAVDIAADGDEAQFMLGEVSYDAVVLDLMVPKRTGWTLLQDFRESGARTPVLILTALDAVDDRVKALDLGADDYLPKPFAISELVARLRALVRRAGGNPSPVLVVGDITIDRAARLVYRENVPVDLTAREYSILELMVRQRGTSYALGDLRAHLQRGERRVSHGIDLPIAALAASWTYRIHSAGDVIIVNADSLRSGWDVVRALTHLVSCPTGRRLPSWRACVRVVPSSRRTARSERAMSRRRRRFDLELPPRRDASSGVRRAD